MQFARMLPWVTYSNNTQMDRFIKAQENIYQQALSEIKNGRKQSHWMWFIFPQIAGLGRSETARYYALNSLEEAALYLQHPLLGARLKEISEALLLIDGKTAHQVFGYPDDLKLKSCMTLFSCIDNTDPVFAKVLDKYFQGDKDEHTLELL